MCRSRAAGGRRCSCVRTGAWSAPERAARRAEAVLEASFVDLDAVIDELFPLAPVGIEPNAFDDGDGFDLDELFPVLTSSVDESIFERLAAAVARVRRSIDRWLSRALAAIDARHERRLKAVADEAEQTRAEAEAEVEREHARAVAGAHRQLADALEWVARCRVAVNAADEFWTLQERQNKLRLALAAGDLTGGRADRLRLEIAALDRQLEPMRHARDFQGAIRAGRAVEVLLETLGSPSDGVFARLFPPIVDDDAADDRGDTRSLSA